MMSRDGWWKREGLRKGTTAKRKQKEIPHKESAGALSFFPKESQARRKKGFCLLFFECFLLCFFSSDGYLPHTYFI